MNQGVDWAPQECGNALTSGALLPRHVSDKLTAGNVEFPAMPEGYMSLNHERETVRAMIRLFCQLRHNTSQPCESCRELIEYADERLGKCPFGDEKPTCQRCHVHCYGPQMRERITEVMRFSGPRMMLHHPVRALQHLLRTKRPGPSRNDQNS